MREQIKTTVGRTLFPYCLERRGVDGAYVALNRAYKPLGFITQGWVRYDACPVGFRFARLTPATIRALSCDGSDNPNAIHLYTDAHAPFCGNEADTRAYLKRLEHLARLTVYAVEGPAPLREGLFTDYRRG